MGVKPGGSRSSQVRGSVRNLYCIGVVLGWVRVKNKGPSHHELEELVMDAIKGLRF